MATTACEKSLVDFFNSVIECINNTCGMVRVGRRWTTDSAMCPLNGGNAVRKPDMSWWLAPGSKFDWRHLATFAEVKNHRGKDKEKSSYIDGSLSTCGYDINDKPCDFMCILIGITSASNKTLSFNTLITWEQQPYNSKTVGMKMLDIWEGNTKFTIELDRVLFISDNLFGQGTTFWGGIIGDKQSVTGEQVAVKDLWIDPL
ncbi:hypothetical protein F5141DRAFT_1067670 [Pisolithus sp. B1]|nr:hypothetical protein F5141DRAFT_1067670 [Pisolithus sp. B1]